MFSKNVRFSLKNDLFSEKNPRTLFKKLEMSIGRDDARRLQAELTVRAKVLVKNIV
jgi:hypothetical protein